MVAKFTLWLSLPEARDLFGIRHGNLLSILIDPALPLFTMEAVAIKPLFDCPIIGGMDSIKPLGPWTRLYHLQCQHRARSLRRKRRSDRKRQRARSLACCPIFATLDESLSAERRSLVTPGTHIATRLAENHRSRRRGLRLGGVQLICTKFRVFDDFFNLLLCKSCSAMRRSQNREINHGNSGFVVVDLCCGLRMRLLRARSQI